MPVSAKVRLPYHAGCTRIGIVPQHQPAPLDELLTLAQGYAEFTMRKIGHFPLPFIRSAQEPLIPRPRFYAASSESP
jgi:hypothetical protein